MVRPYIICHMLTSIDGKTLSGRWGKLPGGRGSAGLFETTAAALGVGSWLVGTTTMTEFAAGGPARLPAAREPVPAGDFVADPKAKTLAVGADAHGVLRFNRADVDGDHTVILTTSRSTPEYRAHLRAAGVSYLICGPDKVNLPRAVKKLHQAFCLKKLVAQGGGTFNGAMLRAGLIDEISHVIAPVVDGGGPGVTGFFDPPGKPAKAAAGTLKLISHETLEGDVQWFRWRVHPNA